MSVAADPASGSEIATAIVVSPRITGGSSARLCSSVPDSWMTRAGPAQASKTGHAATGLALASSSMTISASSSGRSDPPYSAGCVMPSRPRSARTLRSESGSGVRASSHARAYGAYRSAARSAAICRNAACSGSRVMSEDISRTPEVSSARCAAEGLVLQELADALEAALAADPRLPVPAERREQRRARGVVRHGPGAQAPRGALGQVDVIGVDRGRQSVGRAVGDLDRLVIRAVAEHREHGPEDLLLGDPHVRPHVGEYGRLEIEPVRQVRGLPAPGRHPRTFILTGLDVSGYPLELPAGAKRTEVRGGVSRVTHPEPGQAGNDGVHHVVAPLRRYDQAGEGYTDLPLERDEPRHQRRQHAVQGDVLIEDRRRLAAELERDVRDPAGARGHHRPPGGDAARKADLVHLGVVD